MNKFRSPSATYIESVALRVVDINKSVEFYKAVLGFEVVKEENDQISLGFEDRTLLVLKQAKTKKHLRAAGLYHVAYLLPNRSDLANWLAFHIANKTPLEGSSDHEVSEAIYLSDIDGNGIEIYIDKDPSTWNWRNERVNMVTIALDIEDLFKEITIPSNKLPKDTIVGHIHLSVLDIETSKSFYSLLGFNLTTELSSAAFMSFENYHHHLGMNTWNMYRAVEHDKNQSDIDYFVLKYPGEEILNKVLENLDSVNHSYTKEENLIKVEDVNGINIHMIY